MLRQLQEADRADNADHRGKARVYPLLMTIDGMRTKKRPNPIGMNQKFTRVIQGLMRGFVGLILIGSTSLSRAQEDGSEKWIFQFTTGTVFLSSPAVGADGTIYIGTEASSPTNSRLMALNPGEVANPADRIKWMIALPDWIDSSPAIGSDGTIYIGCWDGNLYAIRPSGSERWAYDTGNFIYSSPAIGSDGTLYVGSGDGNLHAVKPDGTLKWTYPTGDWVDSSPAVGPDGTVYVGSWDYSVYAIDAEGELKWSYATGGPVISSPAIDKNGIVYVGSDDGSLYALRPDGSLLWTYETDDSVQSSPTIGVDGTVYVGSFDGYLHAVNPDGSEQWRYLIAGTIVSSAAVRADGSIVFGGGDNNITCLNSDGTLRWSFLTGDWVDSSPAVAADGTIVAGSFDNRVYALNGDHDLADSMWPSFHRDVKNTGSIPLQTPEIAVQPFSLVAAPEDRVIFQVVPENGQGVFYEWWVDGAIIDGAESAILDLGAVTAAQAGTYLARVSNTMGETWSDPAVLQVIPGADSRLANISTRGEVIGEGQTMIPGFVTQGTGNLSVLIRGVGPTLTSFGVVGANPNPRLEVIAESGLLIANDRWEEAPNLFELTAATTLVGAFPLDSGSEDAAALVDLAAGKYTAKVTGVDEAAGINLVEAYEVAVPTTPIRLVNISNRGKVGTGAAVMIPGFVINGEAGRAVLIRGIGPTLADFGVTGVLEDPKLVLYRGTESGPEIINANDDWSDAPNAVALAEAAALVGAFSLEIGSADAAVLTVLPPGKYTAQVEGADGSTGEALVEVYRLP